MLFLYIKISWQRNRRVGLDFGLYQSICIILGEKETFALTGRHKTPIV